MANDRRKELRERIVKDLSFKGCEKRINMPRPYATISQLGLKGTRNLKQRLEAYGVTGELINGSTVLDVGCCNGALFFALQDQGYKPASMLGYEYDSNKVTLAKEIAEVVGLEASFKQADMNSKTIEGVYDVVFCLALIGHLEEKNRGRLLKQLYQATGRVLFFEGNKNTDASRLMGELASLGFKRVQYLGKTKDDAIARPMFVCYKTEENKLLGSVNIDLVEALAQIDHRPDLFKSQIDFWAKKWGKTAIEVLPVCTVERWTREELERVRDEIFAPKCKPLQKGENPRAPRAANLPIVIARYNGSETRLGLIDGIHRLAHLPEDQEAFVVFVVHAEVRHG